MNFQTFVGTQPSPAVAGDFASSNPRSSVLAGPGGLVAGLSGVLVGQFGWLSYDRVDANDAPAEVNNFGVGVPDGFVHREQQGLITVFLSDHSMLIPSGFAMTLMDSGDYWVVNSGTTEAVPGMACYAAFGSGLASFAASGSLTSASATGSIAAATFAVTASIANDIMTVTAVTSGTIVNGATLTTLAATGTQVTSQELPLLAGEALGGVGRYSLSIGEQTVASGTIDGTYGIFTAASALVGQFSLGDSLTGTSVVAGTSITQFLTGTGGLGTYAVNNNTVVTSTTITAGTDVQTKWFARSVALPGELVKISSNVQ